MIDQLAGRPRPGRRRRDEVRALRLHPQRRPLTDGAGAVRAPRTRRPARRVRRTGTGRRNVAGGHRGDARGRDRHRGRGRRRSTSRCSSMPTRRSPSTAGAPAPTCRPASKTGTLPTERAADRGGAGDPRRDRAPRPRFRSTPPDDVRADRSAHRSGARMLPVLDAEFGGKIGRGDPRLRGRDPRQYDDVPVARSCSRYAHRDAGVPREGRCATAA